MPGEIDTLRIKIESNSDKARQNIQYLVTALGELRRISGPTASELHAVNSELREMIDNLKGIKGVRDPFTNFSRGAEKAAQKAHDLGNAMRKARGEAESVQKMEIVPIKSAPLDAFVTQIHVAHDAFNRFAADWEAFKASHMRGALPSGGGSQALLEDFNNRDGNVIDSQVTGEYNIQFNEKIFETNRALEEGTTLLDKWCLASEKIAAVWHKVTGVLSKAAGVMASVLAKGIHAVGNAASKAVHKVTRFFASIVRIAKYRAIRAALRAITDGLSTGIENLYLFSEAYNTNFAPTMDRLSSSMLYMKNAFGAMFSPLIEYFTPLIETLVDKLVNAFNWVQKLFSQLTGRDIWYKAVKVQKKYKDSTDNTTQAVKSLKEELRLMDFDELNNITESQNDNTPAASKAPTEPDPTTMFTIEETPNPMEGSLWENIKKKFFEWLGNNGWLNADGTINWQAIGESIGTKIREWLGEIDWKGIWETIKRIANAIADFTEGVFRGLFPKLFQALDNYNQHEQINREAEAAGAAHAMEARQTGDLVEQAKSLFDGTYEGYLSAVSALNDLPEAIRGKMNDLYIDPRTGRGRRDLYESLYENKDTLFGNQSHMEQLANDKDYEAYANYREQLDKISEAYIYLGEQMDIVAKKESGADLMNGKISTFFNDVADRMRDLLLNPSPTETWAESVRDNLDVIEDSGALAGTAYGKWFGDNASQEATSKIQEELGNLEDKLTVNPIQIPIKLRYEAQNILRQNAPTASGASSPYNKSALDTVRDAVLPGGAANIWQNIKRVLGFAEGGYPTRGTMFYAGEAGAEFVGNINGKTGVVSGQEITGIGDAVWSTGNTTANILGEILTALREKELTITPSSALGKVVTRSQKLYQAQMG